MCGNRVYACGGRDRNSAANDSSPPSLSDAICS
ncbi:MAG: hypothetical protein ACRD37_00625, partial [Candidatus Acidiferrales bacterium]